MYKHNWTKLQTNYFWEAQNFTRVASTRVLLPQFTVSISESAWEFWVFLEEHSPAHCQELMDCAVSQLLVWLMVSADWQSWRLLLLLKNHLSSHPEDKNVHFPARGNRWFERLATQVFFLHRLNYCGFHNWHATQGAPRTRRGYEKSWKMQTSTVSEFWNSVEENELKWSGTDVESKSQRYTGYWC